MAGQTTTSALYAKYGKALDAAVRKHAADETSYGIQDLPGGINGGIAQVQTVRFGVYKKGDHAGHHFFMAQASVHKPVEVILPDGSPFKVKGLFTKLGPEPLCTSKDSNGNETTQEEHVARILNWLRGMAGEEFTKGANGANLEALAAQVEKSKPFIKFSTRDGKPTKDPKTGLMRKPMVFHSWHGPSDYVPEDGSGIQDDTGGHPGDDPSLNGTGPEDDHGNQDEPPRDDGTTTAGPVDDAELENLVALCNADDEDATRTLTDMALANGWGVEQVKKAPSWEEVAEMAKTPPDGSGEDATEDTQAAEEPPPVAVWKPKEGETCRYKPPGGKGKPAAYKILKVYGKAKTADLQSLVNPKAAAVKNVPLSELTED